MNEHEVWEGVELARSRLDALRRRFDADLDAPGAAELTQSLSELHDTLARLHARYGLLRDILDKTTDIVFAKHLDGRYALINPRGARALGQSIESILGSDDHLLFTPADAERLMAIDREVIRTKVPQTREETCELAGAPKTLLVSTSAWYDGEGQVRGVIGIAQDTTERRQTERRAASYNDRLSKLSSGIVFEEERLRRSLAAELHSGLGQEIALAKLKLSMLRGTVGVEFRDPLTGIEQLVDRADRSLRSITFQISPPSLHDLGLVAALEWLADDMQERHGLAVTIEDSSSPAVVDEKVRVILFRAVRELLTNVATHAGTGAVTVRLKDAGKFIVISVADAGVGFDAEALDARGYGLFGIGEQLRQIKGSLQVESTVGGGSTITLTAPVGAIVPEPVSLAGETA